jgi:hypothetical protein
MTFNPLLLTYEISDLPPHQDLHLLATPPALFESQLQPPDNEGGHSSTLEDLIDDWLAERLLPHKTVIIACADGYSVTLTHPDLELLPADKAAYEMVTSCAMIEDPTGAPVTTLSYPWVGFSTLALQVVEPCGYEAACESPALLETFFNLWRAECCSAITLGRSAGRLRTGITITAGGATVHQCVWQHVVQSTMQRTLMKSVINQ